MISTKTYDMIMGQSLGASYPQLWAIFNREPLNFWGIYPRFWPLYSQRIGIYCDGQTWDPSWPNFLQCLARPTMSALAMRQGLGIGCIYGTIELSSETHSKRGCGRNRKGLHSKSQACIVDRGNWHGVCFPTFLSQLYDSWISWTLRAFR